MAGLWSDLPRRATVLLIGIPLAGLILSRPLATWLALQVLHLGAAWEWLGMVPFSEKIKKDEDSPGWDGNKSPVMYLFPFLSVALSNLRAHDTFLSSVVAVACFYSLVESRNSQACNHIMKGLLFWTIPLYVWNPMSQDFGATTYLLSVAWNCDSGALIVGRLSKSILQDNRIPPPKWLKRISPAKSIEGIIGGILAGCLTSASWPFLWGKLLFFLETIGSDSSQVLMATAGLSMRERSIVGLILSLLAIIGDLWESSTKRQGGVKDSGKLLPGHGGLLDRFDSALLPGLFYSYFYFQGQTLRYPASLEDF
jgi:CDP-diglyceride synthetase